MKESHLLHTADFISQVVTKSLQKATNKLQLFDNFYILIEQSDDGGRALLGRDQKITFFMITPLKGWECIESIYSENFELFFGSVCYIRFFSIWEVIAALLSHQANNIRKTLIDQIAHMMELIDGAEAELVKSALRLITRLDYESRLGFRYFRTLRFGNNLVFSYKCVLLEFSSFPKI